jgi:hypothetical protein
MEEIKLLAQFGVGGVIAGLALYFYRTERLSSEQRYAALAQDFRAIVTANTAALVELKSAINKQ